MPGLRQCRIWVRRIPQERLTWQGNSRVLRLAFGKHLVYEPASAQTPLEARRRYAYGVPVPSFT